MRHEVKVDLSTILVKGKDISITIHGDGAKMGTLLISKGNIEWIPVGVSTKKMRLTWQNFAELMNRRGKLIRKDK